MSLIALPAQAARTAVAAAVRAPSLLNSQPWRFRIGEDHIDVLFDRGRRLPACDPTGWAMRMACGAATFNLRLALATGGSPTRLRWRPEVSDPDLVARLTPAAMPDPTPHERRLARVISQRRTNRSPLRAEPVSTVARARLIEAARAEQAWLVLVTGVGPVGAVGEVVRAARRVLDRDPRYRAEVAAWADDANDADLGTGFDDLLRPQAPGGTPGGPDEAASTVQSGPTADPVEPEPVVAVLGSAGDLPIDQLSAGYALQRVLLTAADLGLAVSMHSQAIEVPAAREQLRLALGRFGAPQMVLRLGRGEAGTPTARRDPAEVIDLVTR